MPLTIELKKENLMNEEKKGLFARINAELQQAMKSKDEFRLSVLRMLKSKILYVNARGEMEDGEIVKIINKYGKDLKESMSEFQKVGRTADVAQAEKELAVVKEYLPAELSLDELKKLVQATIAEVGAASSKDMGKVMKAVGGKAPGADGKVLSQLVRELLQ
jgi:hypothetical protein